MTTDGPDPDVAAAELALGLLDGEERATALRRVLAEPDFAAEVERWRQWLAQLFDLWPEAEPPENLIDRIDASLGGPAPLTRRRHFPWPMLAIASSALAACLLVFVAIRPSPPISVPVPAPVAARPPLVAAMAGQGDARSAVAATFDAVAGQLRLTAAPTVPTGRVAQLWVIGGDGVPHPLGLLASDATQLILSAADRARMIAGVTLAISIEPPGGSPTGKPTGAVIAAGALAAV